MLEWNNFWKDNNPSEIIENIYNNASSTLPLDRSAVYAPFKFFKPEETKVIILGQDPYPNVKDATGLAFSCEKVTPSLRNIFACLRDCGLIKGIPQKGDLTPWAKRGVLLLNSRLTLSRPKELDTRWIPWVQWLVPRVMNASGCYLFIWGGEASKLFKDDNLPLGKVFRWGHPSPLNPHNNNLDDKRNFRHCDHFSKVEGMDWSLDLGESRAPLKVVLPKSVVFKLRVVIFTDGGCTGNGVPGATGYSGVYCPDVFHGIPNIFSFKLKSLVKPLDMISGVPMPVTSNRAELYAIYTAIHKVLEYPIYHEIRPQVEIITDSQYCIKVLDRIVKGENTDANRDIQECIAKLLPAIYGQLKYSWMRAHGKDNDTEKMQCNNIADSLTR